MFKKVKDFVITSKEKAAVAFLVAAVGSYLAQNGLTVADVWSRHGLQALAVGVVTHLFVYFTSNTPTGV